MESILTLILLVLAISVPSVLIFLMLRKSRKSIDTTDWKDTVDSYVSERIKTTRGISLEVSIVTSALRQDPEYAWGWYCNLKMSFMDQGCPALVAAKGAASFLRIFADVKMEENPLYVEDIRIMEESAFAKLQ